MKKCVTMLVTILFMIMFPVLLAYAGPGCCGLNQSGLSISGSSAVFVSSHEGMADITQVTCDSFSQSYRIDTVKYNGTSVGTSASGVVNINSTGYGCGHMPGYMPGYMGGVGVFESCAAGSLATRSYNTSMTGCYSASSTVVVGGETY